MRIGKRAKFPASPENTSKVGVVVVSQKSAKRDS